MGVIRSSKRYTATTRSKQHIEPDLQRLRELVADLSFSKIIHILEILENNIRRPDFDGASIHEDRC